MILLFQTILLGDSGVGKTSLLVKYDTGKFQTGNFSATVGIGFTVSIQSLDNAIFSGVHTKDGMKLLRYGCKFERRSISIQFLKNK